MCPPVHPPLPVSYCILLLECKSTCHTQMGGDTGADVHIYGIPHHLVMLPPMMNMEFYDIDIVVSRSVWWCL